MITAFIFACLMIFFNSASALLADAGELKETDTSGPLPFTVENEKFPCDYKGKEWITYDLRLYPKWADRKGTLRTFAIKIQKNRKIVTGYKKVCVYKIVDVDLNRYEQAIDPRIVTYGPYHIWRSDGLMVESGTYNESVRDGARIQYDENGIPVRRTEFIAGKIQGLDEYFNEYGYKCSDVYRQGIVMRHTCYFPNSNIVWKDEPYLNGLKHGTITLNFPDGRPEQVEQWQFGRYHGIVRKYQMFPDRHFLYTESNYQQGVKSGQTMIWDGEGRRLQ